MDPYPWRIASVSKTPDSYQGIASAMPRARPESVPALAAVERRGSLF
jgi:hypothetical protein